MKIDLFPICQADLDLYKSWIRLLEAVQVMSRYYPKHFIDTNRIESNACLWMKIVINEPDQASVSIGTIWLERINKKDSLATMGILIGSEEYRGKGIGKIAIEEIILQAINYFNNLTHIKLNVRESNKAAIACYLKSGFKIESKNEKVRNNNKITYYEMIRKIMTDQRNNKYIETANLYDYDVRNTAKDDIDFYFEYANKANGDILELGCGTGRLTIPFAKENFNIWGLDLSCPMLEVIRSKIENLPDEFKKNIHITHQNMASFQLDKKFGMIFIPFRTFQSLTSIEEQNSCLKAVHEHLNDDGIFIVNVFKPYDKIDRSWINKDEVKNWETVDVKNNLKIVRKEIRDEIDVENQIIYPVLFYYVTDQYGKTKKYTETLSLKYYYEDQIKDLLESNGFEIMEEFGYYNKIPIKDGSEIILVCRKNKVK